VLNLIIVGQIKTRAGIAQLVEQRTENPRVTSSSLVPGITLNPLRLSSLRGFSILYSRGAYGYATQAITDMLKYKP
jgi:hypothetical protein